MTGVSLDAKCHRRGYPEELAEARCVKNFTVA
jgi:hypothetical protein